MMRSLSFPSRRARTSCSILALATVLVVGASPAAAQSFQGTGTFTTNGGLGAAITTPNAITTNISVNPGQTVIDWSPFDVGPGPATIQFQYSGSTASFSGSGNYAVLNRINPADSTRSITMNGTIQALALGFAGASNGSIYFYSPGGFVIGANAVINVGSLVLSASPITVTGGNFITGASNSVVTFGQATNPLARILTTAGSQINASATDAYVAMVAPRVEHRGSINVSGSAALVGAEAATINFSPDGLFDIQVTTGTTDANGVYSSGTITGAASDGTATDIHRAYLVAVPKNSALTMAIIQGGSLGFNIAGAANVVGNTVVLSAGYNITDGVINTAPASAGGANKANLSVSGANMTSALTAAASGVADIFSNAGQASNFASNVTVRAVDHVWVNASGSSATLNIAGNLDLSTVQNFSVDGQSNIGGFVALYAAPGGRVTVGGNATLTALGYGGFSATGGLNGGNGTGGQIWVQSEGNSTLSIGGNLLAWAPGNGGNGNAAGANGGAGTGGQILIRTFGANSLLTVGGSTAATADGYGGNATACLGCSGSGGIGTGGTVSVSTGSAAGSSMTLTGPVSLQAMGRGGNSSNGGAGGMGKGGAVTLSADIGSTLALNNSLYAQASGFGGFGSLGGAGEGGSISLFSSASLTVAGFINAYAEATGGTGLSAAAGDAQGGTIFITASDGGSLALNGLSASADAWGGHAGGAGSDGGDATGGTVALYPTGNGSSITATTVTLRADAYGGRGDGLECFTCDGDGGTAKGGGVYVGDTYYVTSVGVGNSIDFTGALTMSANGSGGVGVGTSGNGTGGRAELGWYDGIAGSVTGDVSIYAVGTGGDNFYGGTAGNGYGFGAIIGPDGGLTIGGNVYLDATGHGGNALGVGGGTGGIGDGGVARLFNGLGTISIAGNHRAVADGFGGDAYLGTGGDGIGGLAPLNASDSEILIDGWADISANGFGGEGNTGGDGTGGIARLLTTGGNLTIGGYAAVIANAFGGVGNSGNGGDAYGGDAYIHATNGTVTITGDTRLNALGLGGGANASLTAAGDGYGGDATIRALSGGTINLGGTLLARASAFGGDVFNAATTGGDGHGGNVLVEAIAANATIIVAGAASLRSYAAGSGDGNGTGGSVRVEAYGAATASLNFQSDLEFLAVGQGGGGYGPTGDGQGGEALLRSTAGSQISVGGDAILNSNAFGGYNYDFTSGSGGDAVGGTARIETYGTDGVGGNIDIVGNAIVRASGVGGDAWGTDFNGGNGTGGSAHILTTLGTITIGNDASVYAKGIGGYAPGGTGGDGFGGTLAEIAAINGDINIGGHAAVSASGFGGDGRYGGDGFGGGESILEEDGSQTIIDGARIFAKNGDIVIGNGATVSATGAGGDGGSDNGYGADYGGDGGDGFGGFAKILAQNGDLGPSSITIVSTSVEGSGTALVDVDGTGGNGGNGRNNNVGGNGGRGGNGFGGSGGIYAAAGNGLVTIDDAIVRALGIGGSGGIGGNGDGGAGGNGGRGGNGVGGTADVGTISGANGEALGSNNGVGNYGTITANASAVGGIGGRGSSGATNGNGGNGGNATGGRALILVRGSTVNVEAATLTANATGGNAGFGYVPIAGTPGITGIGGNAKVGGTNRGIGILATGRYLIPTQRGTLNAGTINGTAIATAGIGIPNGTSQSLGGSGVVFLNADGNIGSLDFLVQADAQGVGAANESISIINGEVVVDDEFNPEFSFVTSGNLSLFANNGDMHAGILTLSASDFVFDAVNDPPSNRGTYFANGATITTGNNFVTSANLDIGSDFEIIAPGLINAANIDVSGELYLEAQSGSIELFNLAATGDIDLLAATYIMFGNATAGETIDMDAGGYIDGGYMTAGDSVYVEAGEYVDLLDISAGIDIQTDGDAEYNVGILAGTTIDTGNIEAFNSIGLGAQGDIYTGSIDARNIFLALGGDDMSFGTINADNVTYLAHSSMIPLGGDLTGGAYNPAPILTQSPVASGGSITLRGPVTTGTFYAAAGTFVDGGNITSDFNIDIDAGTDITLDNLVAGLTDGVFSNKAIHLDAGGLIDVGDVTAIGGIDFEANGSITGGDITSGEAVYAEAEGAIILENISAGLVIPQPLPVDEDVAVGILSATSIQVENVNSAESVGFVTLGTLDVGNITITGGDMIALAGVNMDLGTINASGRVYLANASIFVALEDINEDVSAEDVLNTVPVATAGSILTGPITAGRLQAAAGTTLTIDGNISTDTSVSLFSGGAMLIESVDAGSSIGLRSDATITGDNLTAGSSVSVEANGAISLDNILAGTGISALDVGTGSPVEIFTHGSIVTGNITTDGYVGLYAEVDLTVGAIDAGHDVIALVGDDASFGPITTPERFFLGGYAMTDLVGGGEGFNPGAVFGVENQIATGGSATFAGSSSAESFEAYVGDDTTLASLQTVDFAEIDTGGLFTLTGALNGDSRVISNDIDIGANASVNNGSLSLISRNGSQTLIGDGLDALGQGYRLSDAEVDRIHTSFEISADTSYGAAAKMIIGDLSVNGGGGSEYDFATINGDPDNASVGSIKVVGDVVFSGLGASDVVSFDTNLFELDAATGSITLYGQGTTLGGELGLYAPRVWVASSAILAKLEANPTYAGYIAELNAPAAVQRPEGVLRAASFDIDSGEEPFQSFLVQNTGTAATPAGFVIDGSDLSDDEGSDDPPGSINLVINGQIITAGGTLTGIAARDLLVSEVGSAQFAAGSMINGCVLVGPCSAPAPPKIDTVTSTDVQLTGDTGLGDGLFGNEGDIDDGESGDEGDRSSPISPPNPLFDSRPLVQSGDVDDPVSGAGNPSLYGSPDDEEEDEEEKKKKAKAKQGDGK